MFFSKTLAAAGLVTMANAHMLMKSPAPFPSQNNGPLDASGSNFPCKSTGGAATYTGGEVNKYAQGSKQTLSTIGGATHGGGSCQISITYDENPTAQSVWKVIHSIEGGCPARNQVGNAGNDASAVAADTYDFTVPEDLPAGKGVVAWTWINRVGNREFYMNCGAVEITGSGGSKETYNALPDMAVFNIGDHPQVPSDNDVKFANPGKSVEDNTGQFPVFQAEGGSGGSGSGSGSGVGVGVGVGAGAGSGSGSGTDSGDAPAASAPGGVFVSVGPSEPAAPTSAPAAAPTEAAPAPPPAAPSGGADSGSGAGAGAGAGGAGALTGPCSPEGTFNCIGGTSFQQCASGTWSAPTQMAPGTSTDMKIAALAKKRTARAFRA